MVNNSMASNKTSNQTSENQDDNQWPRFLIMEAADQNVPLNLNAFVLKKATDGMANAITRQCETYEIRQSIY